MALNKLFQEILKGATRQLPKSSSKNMDQGIADFVARARMQDPAFAKKVAQAKLAAQPVEEIVEGVDLPKVVGAGVAALGGYELAQPEDAEAGPLGKAVSGTWKVFKDAMGARSGKVAEEMRKIGQVQPAKSKAHDVLKGAPLRDGVVSGVYQGGGNKRYIHMEDGRIFPTDTKTLGEIVSEYQTKVYDDKFLAMPESAEAGSERWTAMIKSLKRNEKIALPPGLGGTKPTKQHQYEWFMQNREGDIGAENMVDQVMVQSTKTKGYFMWPKGKAEMAEAAGLVKIDKSGWTPYSTKEKK
jgi:hypothetical protein